MKISFIIPVYNCKAFLPDCVSSIRSVGLPDYEIFLIDDGSTDGSGALCDEFAKLYSEVRVIHQANSGVSAARNRGLRESAGNLVLFMDADDSIVPELLSAVLSDPRCLQTDLTIFGLSFDYYKNGKCYRQDPLFYPTDVVLSRKNWGESFLELFERNSLSPVWNKVYKKDFLIKNSLLFNEGMFLYEDLEFVLRYMQHCDKIWNVPKAIYHYRQSEDEGNAKRRLKLLDSIPVFLNPIELALRNLPECVSKISKTTVLQQLHLFLAREKISVSDIRTIQQICWEYQKWSKNRLLPVQQNKFQKLLLEGKATQLYLRNKKAQFRHWCAVRVKAMLRKLRK